MLRSFSFIHSLEREWLLFRVHVVSCMVYLFDKVRCMNYHSNPMLDGSMNPLLSLMHLYGTQLLGRS
jgi:hypothetical protein